MKSYLHLTIFLLGCLGSLALNAQSGNIVIFSPTGNHFYLTVDNNLQTAEPQKNVKITGVPEGNSFIKVEFWDKTKPMLKQSVTVEASKETSYILKKEGGQYVLEQYSSVPMNQVGAGASDSKQFIAGYNRSGVAKIEVDKVEEEPDIFAARSVPDPANSNTGGVYTGGELASKRQGNFKITEKSGDENKDDIVKEEEATSNTAAVEQPKKTNPLPNPGEYPQTSETITYKTEATKDGGTQIVEVRTINIKELVEVNGQKFIKTKNEIHETVTDFQCIPMSDDDFEQASNRAQIAAASMLQNCLSNFSGKCLSTEQAAKVKAMLPDAADWEAFVEQGKPQCATLVNCPFEKEPEVVVGKVEHPDEPKVNPIEVPKVEPVVEPKTEPVAKTAKELKAELKAAQKREKEAAKAAKAAEKAAAKAAKGK